MKPAETDRFASTEVVCPLCHTVDSTVTQGALAAGATWKCTRCGQPWTAERLERVAAYARLDAAHLQSFKTPVV